MYVCLGGGHVYVSAVTMMARRGREGADLLDPVVSPWYWCWEWSSGPLQERQELLTAEPSLQPLSKPLLRWLFITLTALCWEWARRAPGLSKLYVS